MTTTITKTCDKCKKEGYINLEDAVRNKDASGIPKGWWCRDLGEWGEYIFLVCDECSSIWKDFERDEFMLFIQAKNHITDAKRKK